MLELVGVEGVDFGEGQDWAAGGEVVLREREQAEELEALGEREEGFVESLGDGSDAVGADSVEQAAALDNAFCAGETQVHLGHDVCRRRVQDDGAGDAVSDQLLVRAQPQPVRP